MGLSQNDADPAVADHVLKPLDGIGGIHGHVGTARLGQTDEPNHQVEAALHTDAHHHLGTHAQFGQVSGHLVRAGIELAVGELLVSEGRGGGIGAGLAPLLEEPMQSGFERELYGLVVPLHDHLLALVARQKLRGLQARFGVRREAAEKSGEVACHAAHGGLAEELGIERQAQVRLAGEVEDEIQAGAGVRNRGLRLKQHEDLKEGPRALDAHAGENVVQWAGVGTIDGCKTRLHSSDQAAQTGIACEVQPQGHYAPRAGNPHDQVILSAGPVHQSEHSGQQDLLG